MCVGTVVCGSCGLLYWRSVLLSAGCVRRYRSAIGCGPCEAGVRGEQRRRQAVRLERACGWPRRHRAEGKGCVSHARISPSCNWQRPGSQAQGPHISQSTGLQTSACTVGLSGRAVCLSACPECPGMGAAKRHEAAIYSASCRVCVVQYAVHAIVTACARFKSMADPARHVHPAAYIYLHDTSCTSGFPGKLLTQSQVNTLQQQLLARYIASAGVRKSGLCVAQVGSARLFLPGTT